MRGIDSRVLHIKSPEIGRAGWRKILDQTASMRPFYLESNLNANHERGTNFEQN
jgi:hypothetical protein